MLRRLAAPVLAAAALFSLCAPATAEPIDYFMLDGVSYDPAIPAPEDVFGYEIGERPVRYGDMVAYLRDLAEASDRISVETIGYSHERRPILLFAITAPQHQADLEALREAHLARRLGEAAPDAAPAVVWINFGVHGAESSSMDAAIPLLYHFAAAEEAAVAQTLEETIILAAITLNPDGHARRIDHVETYWSYADVTDPAHEAHNMWIEARTNHYWLDLNRQWLPATQPESQVYVSHWHRWKPHVSADYHEMGSNTPYYFHPGEEARLNPLIPPRSRELAMEIAQRHIAFMDSEARLFATEEVFDNFYIGKGSTFPQVNGSIGILFEAGAARGGKVQTERGLVVHADNVRTQFRTALTTIQGAVELKDELIAYQREFFASAERLGAQDRRRGYVFTAEGDAERALRFVRLLRLHDIDVFALSRDVTVSGRTYRAGESFVVPLAQDQHRMIRGVFDRVTEFEEDIFYDVSGWTLPLTFDLEHAPLAGAGVPALLGDLATGDRAPAAAPNRGGYGYVFNWSQTYAPRALGHLLRQGLLARAANEPFSIQTPGGVVAMSRGSVFIPLQGQTQSADEIYLLVREAAERSGIAIHGVSSGLTPEPGRDLGAWTVFEALSPPKVLLLFNDGVSRYDAGEVWWTLDYRMRMPVTMREKSHLRLLDLDDYTHLVLVGGRVSLNSDEKEQVEGWIRRGGTLIAHTEGARWAQRALLGRQAEDDDDDDDDEDVESARDRFDFEDMARRDAEHVIGGAQFAGDLDITHPLGFGYANREITLHRNATFTLIAPDANPYAEVIRYADQPLLSGYASQRRIEEIAGTPALLAERMGSGAIILMADNPVFRGMYPGTERLLMNAIFLSGLIDRPRGVYED